MTKQPKNEELEASLRKPVDDFVSDIKKSHVDAVTAYREKVENVKGVLKTLDNFLIKLSKL
jgi:hypothetical protein